MKRQFVVLMAICLIGCMGAMPALSVEWLESRCRVVAEIDWSAASSMPEDVRRDLELTLIRIDREGISSVRKFKPDAEGRYVFEELQSGNYLIIIAEGRLYNGRKLKVDHSFDIKEGQAETSITVSVTEVEPQEIQIRAVRADDGRPLAGRVHYWRITFDSHGHRVASENDQQRKLALLPDEPYYFRFESENYSVKKQIAGPFVPSQLANGVLTLEVEVLSPVALVQWSIDEQDRKNFKREDSMYVKVWKREEGGKKLPMEIPETGTNYLIFCDNSRSRIPLYELPDGDYELAAYVSDRSRGGGILTSLLLGNAHFSVANGVADPAVVDVKMTPPAKGTLDITVLDIEGKPSAGRMVDVYVDGSKSVLWSGKSDMLGRLHVGPYLAGTRFILKTWAPDMPSLTKSLVLNEGENSISMNYAQEDLVQLQISLMDAAGKFTDDAEGYMYLSISLFRPKRIRMMRPVWLFRDDFPVLLEGVAWDSKQGDESLCMFVHLIDAPSSEVVQVRLPDQLPLREVAVTVGKDVVLLPRGHGAKLRFINTETGLPAAYMNLKRGEGARAEMTSNADGGFTIVGKLRLQPGRYSVNLQKESEKNEVHRVGVLDVPAEGRASMSITKEDVKEATTLAEVIRESRAKAKERAAEHTSQ